MSALRNLIQTALVLFMLVILVGALLPFTATTRDLHMSRAKCQNNLKQIALALLHYHDTFQHFPTGTIPNESVKLESRLSWCVTILPYVEEVGAYKKIDRAKAWNDDDQRAAVTTTIPIYVCPSISFAMAGNIPAETCFVGIAGIGIESPTLPADDPQAGFFGFARKTSIDDIKDGTSCTLTVVETHRDNGPWAAGGYSTIRGLDPADPTYIGQNRQFGGVHSAANGGWSGRATKVANVAFVDGSVRFLKESIDPRVFEALATIAGREDIPDSY